MSEHINWNHQKLILHYISSSHLINLRLVSRRWNSSIYRILCRRKSEFTKKIKNPSFFQIDCLGAEKTNYLIIDQQKLCVVGNTLYRFGGCHHHRYTNLFEQFSLFGDKKWSHVEVNGGIRPPPTSKAQLVAFAEGRADPFIVLTSDVIRPLSRHLTEIMYSLHGLIFIFNVNKKIWSKFDFSDLKNLHLYTTFFIGEKIVFHGSLVEPESPIRHFIYVFDVETLSFDAFRVAGDPCFSTAHFVVNAHKVVAFPMFYENMRSFEHLFVNVMTFDWSAKRVETQLLTVPVTSDLVFHPIHIQQVTDHILSFLTTNPKSADIVSVNYPDHLAHFNRTDGSNLIAGVAMDVISFNPELFSDLNFSIINTNHVFFNIGLQCLSVTFVVHMDYIYAVCRVKHNNCYYRNVYCIY